MSFRILNPTADWLEWNELSQKVRDLHYSPDYARAYIETYGWRIVAATTSTSDGTVLHPFIIRDVQTEPFLKSSSKILKSFDLVQLYGFGGPILIGSEADAVLLKLHWKNLKEWAHANSIATEYANLHPLLPEQKKSLEAAAIETHFVKDVVVWDLSAPEDPIASLNRGHRSAVSQALAAGIAIQRVESSPANLAIFRSIYDLTMDRRGADDRWRFPASYFNNLSLKLGPNRNSLFFAYAGTEVASAYYLMHDFDYAYYHFGGSDPRFFESRPNNLLMLESARWLKSQGYTHFHLGGGVSSAADDSLLRFKKGFTKETARLYSYSRILHNELYGSLCLEKRNFEKQTLGRELESDYFPLYRRNS